MAGQLGMETEELLDVLKGWKQQGKLRRIGAVVNHLKVGLPAGALVVWQVEPRRVEEVGRILAGFNEVSHAYERKTGENWPYNVYTMVHGKSPEDVGQTVQRMSKACGVCTYLALTTEKELKKVPPAYVKP